MDKMSILLESNNANYFLTYYFVIPNLDAGGAERVTITIARILKSEGNKVIFLNLGSPNGEMESWIRPDFEMISFGYKKVIYSIPKLIAFMMSHPRSCYFASREHSNLVGLIAAKLTGRPIVVRLPNMPKNNLSGGRVSLKSRIMRFLNGKYLKTAKVVIAQNTEMLIQILDVYPSLKGKVVAINNPIDRDYVKKSSEGYNSPFMKKEKSFIAVCTVDFRKGIDVLIKSWPYVKKVIPNAHMYVIGRDSSDYAQKMKNEINGISDFTFLGFMENPYPYMKYCDVFVLPSRMEGFPNVVLEAMCFNKPVVSTTCVDVISEIIKPGVNGYTCGIEDAEALANAMVKASKMKNIHNQYDLFDQQKLINCFQ